MVPFLRFHCRLRKRKPTRSHVSVPDAQDDSGSLRNARWTHAASTATATAMSRSNSSVAWSDPDIPGKSADAPQSARPLIRAWSPSSTAPASPPRRAPRHHRTLFLNRRLVDFAIPGRNERCAISQARNRHQHPTTSAQSALDSICKVDATDRLLRPNLLNRCFLHGLFGRGGLGLRRGWHFRLLNRCHSFIGGGLHHSLLRQDSLGRGFLHRRLLQWRRLRQNSLCRGFFLRRSLRCRDSLRLDSIGRNSFCNFLDESLRHSESQLRRLHQSRFLQSGFLRNSFLGGGLLCRFPASRIELPFGF